MAEIKLAPDNEVTVPQIRELVSRSGFTPKETRVTVVGRLEEMNGDLVLVAGKQQQYRLKPSADAHERPELDLAGISMGEEVEVEGIVPADLPKAPILEVEHISMPPKSPEEREEQ